MKLHRYYYYILISAAIFCLCFGFLQPNESEDEYKDQVYLEPHNSPGYSHERRFHVEDRTEVHLSYKADHKIDVHLTVLEIGAIVYGMRIDGDEHWYIFNDDVDVLIRFSNINESGTPLSYSVTSVNEYTNDLRTLSFIFVLIFLLSGAVVWVNTIELKNNAINGTQQIPQSDTRIQNPPPPAYLSGLSSSAPLPTPSATTDMFSPPPPQKLNSPSPESKSDTDSFPNSDSSLPECHHQSDYPFPSSPPLEQRQKPKQTIDEVDHHLLQEGNKQ